MADSKTKYYTFEGKIQYPRVFPENKDTHDEYYGNTDGAYHLTFYPTDVDKFLEVYPKAKGMFKGPLKDDDGKVYVKLTRRHLHKSFTEDNGDRVVLGPPEVVHWGEDESKHNKPWTFADDGALGNDTTAMVKFSVYQGRAPIITLVKIGVVDHVPFETDGSKF